MLTSAGEASRWAYGPLRGLALLLAVAAGGCSSRPLAPAPRCTQLSEAACRADARCRADACTPCSGAPVFVACVVAGAASTACADESCPQPHDCTRLDKRACLAAQADGCQLGYCSDCDLRWYVGCLEPDQLPQCPPPRESPCQSCSVGNECNLEQYCAVPTDVDCEDCRGKPSCAGDGECSGGKVCEAIPCCAGQKVCIEPCVLDSECGEGRSCGIDGHCRDRVCSIEGACDDGYSCAGGSCVRASCSGDSDCGSGRHCVIGKCYDEAGTCRAI